MKHIAFHSNQLGLRGSEVALYDYALYNEEILGNKSYIISNANNELTSLQKFNKRFETFLYNSFNECEAYTQNKNIDYAYFIKAGDNDGKLLPGVQNLVHAVFQCDQIHGDRYAYVSKWLATKMKLPSNYVPHIVALPKPTKNFKEALQIPKTNIVIGRYGGYYEFDIPFVHSTIYKVLEKRNDITFLFMNTFKFGPTHPNIIHVNSTYDIQNKANFIETCDYMLHARKDGETFGLSICEFLYGGKPIISWKGGHDKNHIELLKEDCLWYNDEKQLETLLLNLNTAFNLTDRYRQIVEPFAPANVMEQFKTVFLS
jgi:hypothetical protein